MYRIALLALTLVAALPLTVHAAPAPAPASPSPSPSASPKIADRLAMLAPADAYFGPFGMSPLSIRSTIGLLGRQYHQRSISDHDLLRKAIITEDALRRWRTAYPGDTWLAPTFFHLEQLYQSVQTDEARKHATAVLKYVAQTYPATKEGHLSRSRLSQGFPALVAESPLVAPPAPAATAVPTDTVGAMATSSASPAPAPAASNAASSAASSTTTSLSTTTSPAPRSSPSP